MRKFKAAFLIGLYVMIVLALLFADSYAGEEVVSARIVVKFKATSEDHPGVYLRQDAPFQPITGETSLDSFNQSLTVTKATPLFRRTFVKDLRDSQSVFLSEMEAVKKGSRQGAGGRLKTPRFPK